MFYSVLACQHFTILFYLSHCDNASVFMCISDSDNASINIYSISIPHRDTLCMTNVLRSFDMPAVYSEFMHLMKASAENLCDTFNKDLFEFRNFDFIIH